MGKMARTKITIVFQNLMMVTDRVGGDDLAALVLPTSSSPGNDVVPTLRLCQLIRWPSYGGYGFDVVTNKCRVRPANAGSVSSGHRRYGHFIGKVVRLLFKYKQEGWLSPTERVSVSALSLRHIIWLPHESHANRLKAAIWRVKAFGYVKKV